MRDAGAPLNGVKFVAYDERPAMAWIDRSLADRLERFAEPKILGRGAALFEPSLSPHAGMFTRAIVGARLGAREQEFWAEMMLAFGSDRAARAFLLGHEAGHAIGHQKGKNAAAKALLEGIAHPLAQSAARRGGEEDCPKMETALMHLIEEAMCDALGCWAAAKDGCTRAADRCLSIRRHEKSTDEYATGWLIEEIAAFEDLALFSFESLSKEIATIVAAKGESLCEAFVAETSTLEGASRPASKADEAAASPRRKLSSLIFRQG